VFVIGQIVKPQGIHGEVKVKIISSFPERFRELKSVFVGESHASYRVEKARVNGTFAFLKFKGVDDRNQAELLRNCYLYVTERELMPLPDEDAFYLHQIVGLNVFDQTGTPLGTIVNVENYPGNDLFVLEDTGGRQYLIPAIKQFVKNVDIANRTMTIDVVDGLLD